MSSQIAEQSLLMANETRVPTLPGCGCVEVEPFLRAPDRFHGRRKDYELARCPSCSLVWLNDPPSPAEMGEH